MNNNSSKVALITKGAMIAAIYVVLTVFINAFNLANGAIQIRISEALTILPALTPAAIPGLFIGCLISNIVTGCALFDIIFGSIATLLGALGTYFISYGYLNMQKGKQRSIKKNICFIPPVVSNTIIVPLILKYVYAVPGSIFFLMLTIAVGEIISCGIIGMIFLNVFEKYASRLFD